MEHSKLDLGLEPKRVKAPHLRLALVETRRKSV